LLREMVKRFAQGAEADAVWGAAFGERASGCVNRRNGYRKRHFGRPRRHDRLGAA